MTTEKMPCVIYATPNDRSCYNGAWADSTDLSETIYLRAEPVKELLKQAHDVIAELLYIINHQYPKTNYDQERLLKTITAIDKFLAEK